MLPIQVNIGFESHPPYRAPFAFLRHFYCTRELGVFLLVPGLYLVAFSMFVRVDNSCTTKGRALSLTKSATDK